MSSTLDKSVGAKPLIAKGRSASVVASRTSYRVSKAQSLRMAAYDKKMDAAEAKAKAAEAKEVKTNHEA